MEGIVPGETAVGLSASVPSAVLHPGGYFEGDLKVATCVHCEAFLLLSENQ